MNIEDTDLYQLLSDTDKATLLERAWIDRVDNGMLFAFEGQFERCLAVLLSGKARGVSYDSSWTEYTLHRYSVGDLLVAPSTEDAGDSCRWNIFFDSPSAILVIPADLSIHLMASYAQIARMTRSSAELMARLRGSLDSRPPQVTGKIIRCHEFPIAEVMLGQRKYARALDVGCGMGVMGLLTAQHALDLTITDFDPAVVDLARSFLAFRGVCNAKFQVSDACNLRFPPASFELVTCRLAAHHFPSVADFLRGARNVLTSDGQLLLIDLLASDIPDSGEFFNWLEKTHDASHVKALSQLEWQKHITDAGFRIRFSQRSTRPINFVSWMRSMRHDDEEISRISNIAWELPASIRDELHIKFDRRGLIQSFESPRIAFLLSTI
ncbi:class I SAM-dependent methyltransferase [Ideonella sp. B508-1]|uniref:class I SAM-dependent methyltransferase n=1 Tax=Ideonella sp. B508-1 TaxID=137716 RepID=UPI000A039F82|nr:class I SAM-dependent methyltransferase [Ideonella sp. B508-1]